jgi:hypothetical protein
MPSPIINCRLRRNKDDDLIKKFNELPPNIETSDVIREALRIYFKIQEKPELSINSTEVPKHRSFIQRLFKK